MTLWMNLGALCLIPLAADACPVCFASKNESRVAYIVTTAVLMTLPWAMIVGFGAYYRKLSRDKQSPADAAKPEATSAPDTDREKESGRK